MPESFPLEPESTSPRDPLVLVEEPFLGDLLYRSLRPLLTHSFDIVDLRWPAGAGVTSGGPGSWSGSLEVELERSGHFPAHVLAPFFAAGPSLDLALRRSDLFRSLLLVEPVVRWIGEPGFPPEVEDPLPLFAPAIALVPERDAARSLAAWMGGFGTDPASTGIVDADRTCLDPERWAQLMADFPAWTVSGQALKEFLLPTLVLTGELSPRRLRAVAGSIARHLTGATEVVLPGSGAFVPLLEPARLAGVLHTFCLERNIPGS